METAVVRKPLTSNTDYHLIQTDVCPHQTVHLVFVVAWQTEFSIILG